MRLVHELFHRGEGRDTSASARQDAIPESGAEAAPYGSLLPSALPTGPSAVPARRARLPAMTRLLAAVLAAATRHDAACGEARDDLVAVLAHRPEAPDEDLELALDRSRRATTALCVALETPARETIRHLAPFARQLVETGAIEELDDEARAALVRPLFEDPRDPSSIAQASAASDAGPRDEGSSDADDAARPLAHEAEEAAISETPFVASGVAIDAREATEVGAPAAAGETAIASRDEEDGVTSTFEAGSRRGGGGVEPEVLFDHLVAHSELMPYESAYRALLGPLLEPWRSLVHAPTVLAVARATTPRRIGGLDVRLEGLVVNAKSCRPSRRHFRQPGLYTEQQWIEQFGAWDFCAHAPAEMAIADASAEPEPVSIGGTAG